MLLMNRRSHACLILLIIGLFRNPVGSQAPANPSSAVWRDPSPHRVQFVTVEPGVRLEVLDWGGLGRNVVLLASSGNSAHVFDDSRPSSARSATSLASHGAASAPRVNLP